LSYRSPVYCKKIGLVEKNTRLIEKNTRLIEKNKKSVETFRTLHKIQSHYRMKYLFFLFLYPLSITSIFAQNPTEKRLKAYVFLSDECPMCQGYAPVLNQLATDYEQKGVEIIGVFPNYYATDSSILAYKSEYNIRFTTIKDSIFTFTNRFKASTTPQVFLVNMASNDIPSIGTEGSVLYAGQIDDAYFRAGKRRGTTSEHYLKAAIDAILVGKKPEIKETKAIGCVIVRD
jgi:thiol-disulfide isomerase/thioredoxin